VKIVGFGGEMEQITLDSLHPYMRLKTQPEELAAAGSFKIPGVEDHS